MISVPFSTDRSRDFRWALREAERMFQDSRAARMRITEQLRRFNEEIMLDYAVPFRQILSVQ